MDNHNRNNNQKNTTSRSKYTLIQKFDKFFIVKLLIFQ